MTRQDRFETYQTSKLTSAEQTAARLEYKATKLLEGSMTDTGAGRKHKWATGREKWEALQTEGRKAAGIEPQRGRGRPKKAAATGPELLADYLERLQNHLEYKLSGNYTEDQLVEDRADLVERMQAVMAAGGWTDEAAELTIAIFGQ